MGALSLALLLVVLPLVLGQPDGWPIWTWVALACSLPSFVLFLSIERRIAGRGRSPLINIAILTRRPVLWPLITIMVTAGGYYALLFVLAQYLQTGLGHTPLMSGLTLVPWVAAFGLAGRLLRRVPEQLRGAVPAAGCALLALAYSALSVMLFSGTHPELLLLALLGLGGFGLGMVFSSLVTNLTNAVPPDYASDISGVSTTTVEIGGVLGVAGFGTLYLAQLHVGNGPATHSFAVVTLGLAIASILAIATSRLATTSPRPEPVLTSP